MRACLFIFLTCIVNTQLFAQQSPNILFIAVDDLRPELGCYGTQRVHSPNIDSLAASGLTFTRAYCAVPVCGASRASLLSGLRPSPTRFLSYSTKLSEDAPGTISLPGHFKANGYTCISLGKIFHGRQDHRQDWSIEPWYPKTIVPGDYQDPVNQAALRAIHEKVIAKNGGKKRRRMPRGISHEGYDAADDLYKDAKIATKAIEQLQELGDTPFFLAVGFSKPHLPFVAPKKYWDLYPADKVTTAKNDFRPKNAPPCSFHNAEISAYTDLKGSVKKDKARILNHGYLACVSFIDAQIGRMLNELDRLKLSDNTIVILWGDHGWNLGEHKLWAKHCNYTTSMRSPLIIRAPGKATGQHTSALTEFVDIYPSLCDLAGISKPKHLEGTSFVPLLQQPDRPWKDAIFCRYQKGDSIITRDFTYTVYRQNNGAGDFIADMLYDHRNDPDENVNIAGDPQHADTVKRLRQRLEAGWKAVSIPR